MAPRGRKIKDGIKLQMEVWRSNKGLAMMLALGYIIGNGFGKALDGIKWPLEIWRWNCLPLIKFVPKMVYTNTMITCLTDVWEFVACIDHNAGRRGCFCRHIAVFPTRLAFDTQRRKRWRDCKAITRGWTEGLSYDIWLFEIIFYNKSVKVYEHLQYWHSSIITIIRHSISQLFGWEI